MQQPSEKKELTFETEHFYAIFAGFLILPAIFILFSLIGAIIMFLYANPSELSGFDLVIYYADVVTIPYLIFTIIIWFMRKRFLPSLMIIFFLYLAAMNITYFINGFQLDPLHLVMSFVWILYFIRSKRVKATFTR